MYVGSNVRHDVDILFKLSFKYLRSSPYNITILYGKSKKNANVEFCGWLTDYRLLHSFHKCRQISRAYPVS